MVSDSSGGVCNMSTVTIYADFAGSGTSAYNNTALLTIGSSGSGSKACLGFNLSSVLSGQITSMKLYLTQSSNIGSEQSIKFGFSSSNTYGTMPSTNYNVTSSLVSGTQRLRVWNFTSAMIDTIKSVGTNPLYFHLRDNGGAQVIYVGDATNTSNANRPRLEITYTETASTFTLSSYSVNTGSNFTMTINPASSSFSHKVCYTVGSTTSADETISAGTTSKTINIPHSYIPNATSSTATITLKTYNGNTQIGTTSATITVTVPSNIVPTVGAIVTFPVQSVSTSGWNESLQYMYIQGITKCTVSLMGASAGTGSSLVSITFSGGGFSKTVVPSSGSASATTNELSTTGNITFSATVTDTRGRTATLSASPITVVAYSKPVLTSSVAERCDSSGNFTAVGTNIKFKANWTWTTLSNNNACTCTVQWKDMTTGTVSSRWQLDQGTFSRLDNSGNGFDINKDYQVTFHLKDTVSTSETDFIITVPASNKYVIFVKKGGDGISFGQYGATTGYLNSKFKIKAQSDIEIGGKLLFPNNAANIPYWNLENSGVELTAGTDLNDILTVGNYYQSTDNIASAFTNKPATLTTGFGMKVFNLRK